MIFFAMRAHIRLKVIGRKCPTLSGQVIRVVNILMIMSSTPLGIFVLTVVRAIYKSRKNRLMRKVAKQQTTAQAYHFNKQQAGCAKRCAKEHVAFMVVGKHSGAAKNRARQAFALRCGNLHPTQRMLVLHCGGNMFQRTTRKVQAIKTAHICDTVVCNTGNLL